MREWDECTADAFVSITGLCGDFPLEFVDRGKKSKPYFDDKG